MSLAYAELEQQRMDLTPSVASPALMGDKTGLFLVATGSETGITSPPTFLLNIPI